MYKLRATAQAGRGGVGGGGGGGEGGVRGGEGGGALIFSHIRRLRLFFFGSKF